MFTPAEVVLAIRASVKVAVGSQPLFDFSEGLIYIYIYDEDCFQTHLCMFCIYVYVYISGLLKNQKVAGNLQPL